MTTNISLRNVAAKVRLNEGGYAKYKEDLGRFENWGEAVQRVMDMHREKFSVQSQTPLGDLIEKATNLYKKKAFLASQRSLQFGGKKLLEKNTRMYNCAATYIDRPAVFGETYFALLCGVGAGLSIQFCHIKHLPEIRLPDEHNKVIYEVEDTIEGWANAINVLMSSYFVENQVFPEFFGKTVVFDTSLIRPKGSLISGGFKAPGPEPLNECLNKTRKLLNTIKEQRQLKSIELYDILMFIADSVIAGGVRRSATIILFSENDTDMLNAKTGNWYQENRHRERSNNSVVLVRKNMERQKFSSIFEPIKQFGEPGFYITEHEDILTNPCVEIGLYPKTEDGDSGWQFCVSYDTKLITKDGIETIGEVAEQGREVSIWNGENWSKVKPIKTGKNRKLYRVSFGDGSYLDATGNHRFLVKNRFQKEYQEVTTLELLELVKTSNYKLSVPRSNIVYDKGGVDEPLAYEYGFILGDACASRFYPTGIVARTPFAQVFDSKWNSMSKFSPATTFSEVRQNENGTSYVLAQFKGANKEFSFKLKYDEGLPSDIFSWSRKSIIDFIAGWIDTDGTKTVNGVRIYGEESKIRDGQLLLSKIGIDSSINCMSRAGQKTNYGVRKSDVWYLQIINTKDLYSTRMQLEKYEKRINKGKNQIVRSVTKLEGLHDSFCFEESEKHQAVFNNVLTKQCNLCEINGSFCKTEESFYEACEGAAIVGTLQAAYTDFGFLGENSKKITEREALLGISITGIMNNPDLFFNNKEVLRKGVEIIRETNYKVAKMIGINPAARLTCVKPSGNSAVLLATSSGIHAEHAPQYIRHVQINKQNEFSDFLINNYPFLIEHHNEKDNVILYPVVAENCLYNKDLEGVRLLEKVKFFQENWVIPGTNIDLCVNKDVRHNVSNTVTVDSWEEAEEFLWESRDTFAGVSFMSAFGDKAFYHAPNTEILDFEEICGKYGKGSLFASGLIVDGIHAFDNLWIACSRYQNKDSIKEDENNVALRKDWFRRLEKFSSNYFDGNDQETIDCIKSIHLLHRWEGIQRKIKNISTEEWDNIIDKAFSKKPEFVDADTLSAQACAGGACEITF